jgi:hypothetical protein
MKTASEEVTDMIFLNKWSSQTLCAGAELGVFDFLSRDATRTAGEVATETGLDPTLLYRLLRALASLGLLDETPGHRFSLTDRGAVWCARRAHEWQYSLAFVARARRVMRQRKLSWLGWNRAMRTSPFHPIFWLTKPDLPICLFTNIFAKSVTRVSLSRCPSANTRKRRFNVQTVRARKLCLNTSRFSPRPLERAE